MLASGDVDGVLGSGRSSIATIITRRKAVSVASTYVNPKSCRRQ
jgi:hypothetical protein